MAAWTETSWAGDTLAVPAMTPAAPSVSAASSRRVPADERGDDVTVVVDQLPGLRHVAGGVLDVLDVVDLAGELADQRRASC